jgi:hypothetical protein
MQSFSVLKQVVYIEPQGFKGLITVLFLSYSFSH